MIRPIILTLQIDAASQRYFDELRTQHFPPSINYLKAHLTLFHQLPGFEEVEISSAVGRACARRAPFALLVSGLMALGRGVAFRIESEALVELRAELAERFAPWLTAQDRGGFRPHITVQNKVSVERARGLKSALEAEFRPFDAIAQGVQLWRYEGGPWTPRGAIGFAQPPKTMSCMIRPGMNAK